VTTSDNRLARATDAVLADLPAEDRMVLGAYYLDGRTLAEIARMLGVHESTISRKLDKLAKALRKQIVAGLSRRGMSRRQAEEALEVDVRDLQVDIRRSLAQDSAPAAFSEKRVEARIREGPG
jgi:RNA polymerase sigma-70 factor (ECF subfamily)